jgi:cyclitol reductase
MRSYNSVELSWRGPKVFTRMLPDDEDTALIVRILKAGICSSDLKEVGGTRAIRRDFGHELVGIVASFRHGGALAHGARVTFDPHVAIERTSGFAEFVIARGNHNSLIAAFPALPERISPDAAVFVEPLACAHHAISQLTKWRVASGCCDLSNCSVAMLGAGLAGVLQTFVLKHVGARPILFNRDATRLRWLDQQRLFAAGELSNPQFHLEASFDAAIISTSHITPSLFWQAWRMVKSDGILLLFGGTSPGAERELFPEDIDDIRRQERLVPARRDHKLVWLGGTYGARSEDFSKSIACLSRHQASFPVERLVADRVGLNDLVPLLTKLAHGGQSSIGKIIVDMAVEGQS